MTLEDNICIGKFDEHLGQLIQVLLGIRSQISAVEFEMYTAIIIQNQMNSFAHTFHFSSRQDFLDPLCLLVHNIANYTACYASYSCPNEGSFEILANQIACQCSSYHTESGTFLGIIRILKGLAAYT